MFGINKDRLLDEKLFSSITWAIAATVSPLIILSPAPRNVPMRTGTCVVGDTFLDALASLAFKLSLSQSVSKLILFQIFS